MAAWIAVHSTLETLYWEIGGRVHQDVLEGERGEFGARIVAAVGRHLAERYLSKIAG